MFISRPAHLRADDESPLTLGSPLILFVLAHVPLALLLRHVSLLAWVHMLLVLGAGLYWAWNGRNLEKVAYVVVYLIGAEIVWRMTNDRLFWETAKYSGTLIFIVALLRLGSLRILALPVLAFGLLLPSAAKTYLLSGTWDYFRDQVSFNLSGPLALVICACFFYHVTLPPGRFQRLLLVLLASIVCVGTLVVYGILVNPDVQFTHESNFDMSGGYGPNQVSSVLGLGALVALLALLDRRGSVPLRVLCFLMMCWFGFQAALTFSRGGVIGAVGAATLAFACLATQPRDLVKSAGFLVLLYSVGAFWIWPQLDAYTGGNLSMRFAETSTTKRGTLLNEDMEIFAENPLLGVGPGVSKDLHESRAATHTEFSRLMAEHGLFGVTFMLVLLTVALRNMYYAQSARERAIVAAVTGWALLFMAHSAMRLVAPSIMFGLGMATFMPILHRHSPASRPARLALPHRRILGMVPSEPSHAFVQRRGRRA